MLYAVELRARQSLSYHNAVGADSNATVQQMRTCHGFPPRTLLAIDLHRLQSQGRFDTADADLASFRLALLGRTARAPVPT